LGKGGVPANESAGDRQLSSFDVREPIQNLDFLKKDHPIWPSLGRAGRVGSCRLRNQAFLLFDRFLSV
jgi:hypothetical protein